MFLMEVKLCQRSLTRDSLMMMEIIQLKTKLQNGQKRRLRLQSMLENSTERMSPNKLLLPSLKTLMLQSLKGLFNLMSKSLTLMDSLS
jgi:hypothetical protein